MCEISREVLCWLTANEWSDEFEENLKNVDLLFGWLWLLIQALSQRIHTEADRGIGIREKRKKRDPETKPWCWMTHWNKETSSWESKHFWSADVGRLSNKAKSTVGVCDGHATLCDPVSLPGLLYRKHYGAASTEEVVGISGLQGERLNDRWYTDLNTTGWPKASWELQTSILIQ